MLEAGSYTRIFRAKPLLSVLLILWLQNSSLTDAATNLFRKQGVPLGYGYEGSAEFTENRKAFPPSKPIEKHAAAAAHSKAQGQEDDELKSLMVLASGEVYSKKLSRGHHAELHTMPAAHIPKHAKTHSSRKLMDLACDGCSATDSRTEVTDTTKFPYSAVGQLVGALPSDPLTGVSCTGTLISPRHVLTAAHCVYNLEERAYIRSNNFAAGLAETRQPFGEVKWKSIFVLEKYVNQAEYTVEAVNYDFALVTLAEAVTEKAGHLTLHPGQGRETVPLLQTAGYPGDKPPRTMWDAKCKDILFDYVGDELGCPGGCANLVKHTCTSSSGQSGSAFWDAEFGIRAVLTGNMTLTEASGKATTLNVGVELNPDVYNVVAQWYKEDPASGVKVDPVDPTKPGDGAISSFVSKNFAFKGPVLIGFIVLLSATALCCVCGIVMRCGRRATPLPASAPKAPAPSDLLPAAVANPVHMWQQQQQEIQMREQRAVSGRVASPRSALAPQPSSLNRQASSLVTALSRRMSIRRQPSVLEESLMAGAGPGSDTDPEANYDDLLPPSVQRSS